MREGVTRAAVLSVRILRHGHVRGRRGGASRRVGAAGSDVLSHERALDRARRSWRMTRETFDGRRDHRSYDRMSGTITGRESQDAAESRWTTDGQVCRLY